jgi:WD40 repeat protein
VRGNLYHSGLLFVIFQVYSVARAKTVARVTRHIDIITCLAIDRTGCIVVSGSKDTTSIVWEVNASGGGISSNYYQVYNQNFATKKPRMLNLR